MDANCPLLSEHIEKLHEMCEHWIGVLLTAPPCLMNRIDRDTVPKTCGLYVIRLNDEIMYVGKGSDLRRRIYRNHLAPRKRSSTLRRKVSKHIDTDDEGEITQWLRNTSVAWLELHDHPLTLAVEDYAIVKLDPPFNGYTYRNGSLPSE